MTSLSRSVPVPVFSYCQVLFYLTYVKTHESAVFIWFCGKNHRQLNLSYLSLIYDDNLDIFTLVEMQNFMDAAKFQNSSKNVWLSKVFHRCFLAPTTPIGLRLRRSIQIDWPSASIEQ